MPITPHNVQSLINQTADLLFPRVWSVQDRKELLLAAFATSDGWILGYIDIDGPPQVFTSNCLHTLVERDCTLVDRLLQTFARTEGFQVQEKVRQLVAGFRAYCMAAAVQERAPLRSAERLTDKSNRPVIFLSYTDAEADKAKQLEDRLALYGHACWTKRLPQKGSDDWLTATAAGLSQAYAVVLLVGKQTRQDRWVQVELLAALDKQKRIIPVQAGSGALPPCLPPDTTILTLDDGDADDDDGWQALLAQLPAPPDAPTEKFFESLSEELIKRANELLYMDRLKLDELQHVARYTRLSGETAIWRSAAGRLALQPVVAHTEYTHFPWREREAMPAEQRRFEDAVAELKAIRRAVLLGEPGSGKTTTLYKLAADLIDAALLDERQPIPVMVRLGSWTEANQPFADFLRRSVGELAEGWEERLEQKRAVLLLDGLNEIPAGQQAAKYRQVGRFLAQHPDLMALVSCREQDYPPERDLALDRVVVAPLDPVRIRQFVHNYLDADYGATAGDKLFWQLAGEKAAATYRQFEAAVGNKLATPFATFWLAQTLPDGLTWGYSWDKNVHWQDWLRARTHQASLLLLAANPYMLFMLVDVYQAYNQTLPANRGQLFDRFTTTLLRRERVAGAERLSLLHGLTELAFAMQRQRQDDGQNGSALTVLPLEAVWPYLDEAQQYRAVSANFLSINESVRFSHQLLQEYFVARAMRERIWGAEERIQRRPVLSAVEAGAEAQRLKAEEIWQPDRWWEPTNWEEATILLAGLYSDDCTRVLEWLAEAQPELAARCIVESGAHTPDETKLRLRDRWLPRLTDLRRDPDARARAAVGRALGRVTLADGRLLDNRSGVGFVTRSDGLKIPDITWGEEVPTGTYAIGGDKDAYGGKDRRQVPIRQAYRLARYPITYAQFHCFVTAPDVADPRWWQGMPETEEAYDTLYRLQEWGDQAFKFWNHPRERVSWYQAVAFCRWLSDKLGYEVDLPHEYEWEAAARYPDNRFYPWGTEFDTDRANTDEANIGQTTAVGLYPQGRNPALGLDDLSGNVWEWCRNKYEKPGEMQVDGSGVRRVVRGGSWGYGRSYARAACRSLSHPTGRKYVFGFRLVVRRPPSQK